MATRADALREAAKYARYLHMGVLAINGGDNGDRCAVLCSKLDDFAAEAEKNREPDASEQLSAALYDVLDRIYEATRFVDDMKPTDDPPYERFWASREEMTGPESRFPDMAKALYRFFDERGMR
jgi:hypothetical protein